MRKILVFALFIFLLEIPTIGVFAEETVNKKEVPVPVASPAVDQDVATMMKAWKILKEKDQQFGFRLEKVINGDKTYAFDTLNEAALRLKSNSELSEKLKVLAIRWEVPKKEEKKDEALRNLKKEEKAKKKKGWW